MTTVQDWPGRLGYWQVGVPPSGPMDEVSLREANLAVGNPEGAPALECTATGPDAEVLPRHARVPGRRGRRRLPVRRSRWPDGGGRSPLVGAVHRAGRGDPRRSARSAAPGCAATWPCAAASTCRPTWAARRRSRSAGSAGTAGAPWRPATSCAPRGDAVPRSRRRRRRRRDRRPAIVPDWEIGVTEGPHAAPEFFTRADIDELYASSYTVHHNSARTGVRLIGPRPSWAREDGGEAGLHPSNIHDVPYAVGALDFTGDTPIILGPDGPSLGGFVCPAVVASGELWKTGAAAAGGHRALRAGARGGRGVAARPARHRRCSRAPAATATTASWPGATARDRTRPGRGLPPRRRRQRDRRVRRSRARPGPADAGARPAGGAGGRGPGRGHRPHAGHPVAAGPHRRRAAAARGRCCRCCSGLEDDAARRRTSCACRRAPCGCRCPGTTRRPGSPSSGTCTASAPTRRGRPWNIEFIRRINGLATPQDVRDIVFAARYLVLGLGDVYLGAPVATPVDPRHRLVTTKYNPARTWTAENSVGIGGAYLCIYGMEGPGGYQFVGRTTQVWNRFRRAGLFAEQPVGAALLRPDRVVPGQRRGTARPARRDRGRARARRRDRRACSTTARTRGSSTANAASIAAFRAAAVGGVRRGEGALAGQRRVRPGRDRARP